MTKFLEDILKQPKELIGALNYLLGEERASLERAAFVLNQANQIYLTGIGASWHAAMAGASIFHRSGHPITLIEASELLHFSELAPGSAVIIISRSGRSIEIVSLLDKASRSDANIVAITNTPDSPLALGSDVLICVDRSFDHAVSVIMYTALALAAGLVVAATIEKGAEARTGINLGIADKSLGPSLTAALLALEKDLYVWRERIEASDWVSAPAYFLARGASQASCHAARLLWEEAAKAPAAALTTGGFRHGPQEIVDRDMRFCIWLDQEFLRAEDLAVAKDLLGLGARVMLIGEDLPDATGELVISLPKFPSGWQFVADIMPAQLAAERLSRLRGVDCDSLRYCSYIVEQEGGILHGRQ